MELKKKLIWTNTTSHLKTYIKFMDPTIYKVLNLSISKQCKTSFIRVHTWNLHSNSQYMSY